jgi:hypothetical protein
MSPQSRLIVYYVDNNNIIADSILLEVKGSCEKELVLTTSSAEERLSPGEGRNSLNIGHRQGSVSFK